MSAAEVLVNMSSSIFGRGDRIFARKFQRNPDFSRALRSRLSKRLGTIFLLFSFLVVFARVSGLESRLFIRRLGLENDALSTNDGRLAALRNVERLSRHNRVWLLRDALAKWTSGQMPFEVSVLAAACAPDEAVSAVLELTKGFYPPRTRDSSAVVDVGANQGWPVTRFSLERGIAHVVSIEPDPRNYDALLKLDKSWRTSFRPFQCAAARTTGKSKMAFHKARNDFGCFDCLDTSGKDKNVYTSEVDIFTLDSVVIEKAGIPSHLPVLLLKVDVQGFEAEVLHGGNTLLHGNRVQHVLLEFDPQLLRTTEVAVDVLNTLSGAGLQCTHVSFSGRKEARAAAGRKVSPVEGSPMFLLPGAISAANAPKFVRFVKEEGGWTDLFCVRRPAQRAT